MNNHFLWTLSLTSLHRLVRNWPRERRQAFAAVLSRATRWTAPRVWNAVRNNLAVINDWGDTSFRPEQVFENFAATLSDFLSDETPAVRVVGREIAEDVRRQGKGAIVLTSHLGHWELGGRLLGQWGWRATAVYQPYRSPTMQRLIQRHRAPDLNYLAVGQGAAEGVTRALQRKEIVVLLGDRPFGEQGLPVPLCGRETRLPRGPFLMACRYGAPVLPGFVLREGNGRYVAHVEEPLWPTEKGPAGVRDLIERAAAVLEKYIRAHADQWFCFQDVWNGVPVPETRAPLPETLGRVGVRAAG